MTIVFRVDSSFLMGTGHMMRCIALANHIRSRCEHIYFVSRNHDGNVNYLISKEGFNLIELKKSNKNQDSGNIYLKWLGVSQLEDSIETNVFLEKIDTDWLIVDHYSLDAIWENQVRENVKKILIIDDLANRNHTCNVLLDQNWFENPKNRYHNLVQKDTKMLLGPKFALLRMEFRNARSNVNLKKNDIKRMFIFFGGSDPENMTKVTCKVLFESIFSSYQFDIVVGGSYGHLKELKSLLDKKSNFNLIVQTNNISKYMLKADLAIGGAGVNTWERMALGLPSLIISFAENHTILLQDLIKYNHVYYIGEAKNITQKRIRDAIVEKINNTSSIKKEKELLFSMVDGKGIERIEKELF